MSNTKPSTGLKIQPPQPPEAKAFGRDYGAYLQVYDKYVERMQEIRKNLREAKPLKSKPGPQGPIITTNTGKKVELVKSAVWTARCDLTAGKLHGSDHLHVVDDLKPIAQEKYEAVVQAAHHSAVAAGLVKPEAAKPKAKQTRPKKRANKSRRDELRAAKAAATLASTLSTAQKDAARAGAKVVKDQGGWNIVVKGAPDASRKGEVAWRRRVAKRFVTQKTQLFDEIARASPQFPQTIAAQAQVTLEKVFDAVKKAGIELAF
jgi:hypothetical protein